MLSIHRAERADALVRGLGDLLAVVPEDPFAREVVAVPSRGVERWLTQTMSARLGTSVSAGLEGDGICANVHFPAPARLVAQALTAGTGVEADQDPWAERRLTWQLLEVIDQCAGEPWCVTLGRHLLGRHPGMLDGQVDQGRRMSVAQRLAALFTSYGAQRPAMVRDWAGGRDTDGFGLALPDDLTWQAELWRRLRAAIGSDSPAERLEAACRRLREDPTVVDLPDRVSVFGPTRLTSEQVAVLEALGEHRDVHLWLPHPSALLWDRVADAGPQVTTRRQDPTVELAEHPLLRSCGRDVREMQVRLGPHPVDHLRTGADEPTTLLGRLQRDLHEDRQPGPATSDTSLQVHACHGRQRQVEVLRELVLGMLEDDPTLELRDVIVMCPDIETYAPLISAAFGDLELGPDEGPEGTVHPGHRLRVRLADRSLRQTNPVLSVVARLLDLADGRLTASEVLDLAAMPAVRHRFGLDDQDLELLGDWVRRSGVRWGLDAASRSPYHLAGVAQNTWRAGLDRVLVGAAMDEDGLRTVGVALPIDDVDSNEVDLAGRFAELVDRLAAAVASLDREQSLAAWVEALLEAVRALTDVTPRDDWQLGEARRQLSDAVVAAGERAGSVPLRLPDARALLAHRLRGRPTRANFRTGSLTMCTMVPMRSVPHRVVCLLGLDDGVFPRSTHVDGDDVLARTPRMGERDARAEDRQLFLDAILAAEERLVVLYTGADERTGAERPPAVPLGELVDVLVRMGAAEVVVRHPLQPFDARNFHSGRFSFDQASYDGAQALSGLRSVPGPFLSQPLAPTVAGDVVALDDLVAFLEHPVRAFLRQRLGLTSMREVEEADDAIPVEVSGLDSYAVGDRLLRAGLAGVSQEVAVRAERLRGDLPPGALGAAVVAPVAKEVGVLVASTAGLRAGTPETVDVALELSGLGDGVRLAGTVPGVYGGRVVRIEYSRLNLRHRLRAWVQVLALAAARPDGDWCAATVGRGRNGATMSAVTPPSADEARALLSALVRLHRTGLTEPLPLAAKTSGAYAEQRAKGVPPKAAEARAAGEWRKKLADGREFGDFDDAEHLTVWGRVGFSTLVRSAGPVPGEAFDDEPHRFGQLARQVFDPLLAHEEIHG